MIALVEALNYRCLRYIQRPLGRMQILIGPNGSGKTTFLDALAFLSTLVRDGLKAAFEERTSNPVDLVWNRNPDLTVELAIEVQLPPRLVAKFGEKSFRFVRYEIQLVLDKHSYTPEIREETALLLLRGTEPRGGARELFPEMRTPPQSVLIEKKPSPSRRTVFRKAPGGNDNYYAELRETAGKGWMPSIRLGPDRSTFANLLEDETRFPATTWLKSLLREGVQRLTLNSLLLRQASPPGTGRRYLPDGSNLPWVIARLQREAPQRFERWLKHVATAIPELAGVHVIEREDDRHAYLVVDYAGGLKAPSWTVSDGTLRFLALSVLAFLPDATRIYLIEEPENGIHPTAIEPLYQALASVYDGQVLVATHSPVLLAVAQVDQLLCFAKTPAGGTDIVRGDEHPILRDWRREVTLGDLFAAGVLG